MALPPKRYAVLDGAHFGDLRSDLKKRRVFARALSLGADADRENAGPWLVRLDQSDDTLGAVIDLVGDKPAAVFWSCPQGEAVLFRHLRTLAMVRLPDGDAVYFRHADPRVMLTMATMLEPHQVSDFYGPCVALSLRGRTFQSEHVLSASDREKA